MNVWRVETLWWRIMAVIGLICGDFALVLAGWSIGDFYFRSAMPWPGVVLTGIGVGGVSFLWFSMIKSGRNGLIWAAHWLFGLIYLLPFTAGLVFVLVVLVYLLPISLSQILVGYGARRDSVKPEPVSGKRLPALMTTAGYVMTSIVVLAVFMPGFRLIGPSWPGHSTSMWEVSRASFVRFPKSARLVNGYANFDLMSSMLLAKVEMNRADVAGLVRSLPPSWGEKPSSNPSDLIRGNGPGSDFVYPRWFTPGSQKCVVYHPGVEPWDSTNVLVTLNDPKRAIVYVYCYED